MFRGIAQLNLDSKGRLAVPARHREALLERCGGHLVITADADRCLL
ncbi:MAG: cell division/cell wall cluster transcriptional repressor MraZ, partial [Betaproteobacteria bacterium]|nr:cell division/cell wall cluster transcriptional repressor MraZ [Betaproteobacteria bacterium]